MSKLKVFFLSLAILTIFPRCALAESPEFETEVKFGLGAFNSAKDSRAEVKSLILGFSQEFAYGLRQKYEVQGWIDSRRDIGRKPGIMGSWLLGVDVNPGVFYSSLYMGMGLMLPTDSYLGGAFQFTQEIEFGIRDGEQKSMGICYKHISSAGIFSPNIGRDFIMVKVGVPF